MSCAEYVLSVIFVYATKAMIAVLAPDDLCKLDFLAMLSVEGDAVSAVKISISYHVPLFFC